MANAYEPFDQSGRKDNLSLVAPYALLREFVSDGAKKAIDVTLRSRAFLTSGAQAAVDIALRSLPAGAK